MHHLVLTFESYCVRNKQKEFYSQHFLFFHLPTYLLQLPSSCLLSHTKASKARCMHYSILFLLLTNPPSPRGLGDDLYMHQYLLSPILNHYRSLHFSSFFFSGVIPVTTMTDMSVLLPLSNCSSGTTLFYHPEPLNLFPRHAPCVPNLILPLFLFHFLSSNHHSQQGRFHLLFLRLHTHR